MKLTLGPILYEWKREDALRFYDDVARMDVDRVYVGEVVCVKKGLRIEDIEAVAGMLAEAGKEVVISTLAVVSNEEELEHTRALVGLPYPVEANDMSVFNMVDSGQKEIYAGPHITSYNVPSIEFLKGCGVRGVTFPVEISGESVAYNIEKTGIPGEVFAHGKVPLAFSWRCYTSRAYGLNKTDCKHDCSRHPGGMEIKTMDGEPLFIVNGTSILSARAFSLIQEVEDLKAKGVGLLRISPELEGTEKVMEIFRRRMDGSMGLEEGLEAIKSLAGGEIANGWYYARAGKDYILKETLERTFL
jgi:collagenase-like PrtC family protease